MTSIPVPTLIAQSVLIEDDCVRILDRRKFPFERVWVRCDTHHDVAQAIKDMVTQSSGPFFAAAGGMVLAAREARGHTQPLEYLRTAGATLIATRPTNDQIARVVPAMLADAETALAAGEDLAEALWSAALRHGEGYLDRSRELGAYGAQLLRDGDVILTHCWAESYLTETVAAALRQGKNLRAYVTETRPYLQGARLTAESLAEMGVDTTLITDNMGAHVLSTGRVSALVTAADRVTMDGHVINKVGTLQLAVAAHAFTVPYYALVQHPDAEAPTAADVPMEERDGADVLHALGTRTASRLVRGYYPSFDVTPPRFVSAVATDRGRFSPYDLASYYATETG